MGLHALEIIKDKLGIELPEDEAGFFALHIVNAELDGNMHHTMEAPQKITDEEMLYLTVHISRITERAKAQS